MNLIFIKKRIKPFLYRLGIFENSYQLWFFIIKLHVILKNYLYKVSSKTAPILLYHRVDEVKNDPIMLCVTPATFEEHLKFIKNNYQPLPLSELSRRIVSNSLVGNEISITFDDGYQDNLKNALPLLEKYNIPATIFVTTGYLGRKASFKWDMEYSEFDRAQFLSQDEINLLSQHPLIEIGAHTETHPRLIDISKTEQETDILKSKTRLEAITGNHIKAFAYPFGGIYDFDKVSEKIIDELGFEFAYKNTQELARHSNSSFNIPRINIRESSANELAGKLLTFLNFKHDKVIN